MSDQRSKPNRSGGSPPAILEADDLRKSYGTRQALRGLSFSLTAGHVMGFLGPNGAGKTTAIRILTTILEPSSGSFYVDGIRSDHPEMIRQRIGVLPESLGFPKHNTGLEFLTFYGQLYGRTASEAREYGLALLEEVGLQVRGRSPIGSYSRGMRQRLGIARALVNDPAVVFLDEPTLGLDPRGQQELLMLIQRVTRERQVGVILCSHVLSEIEVVCDDVVILNLGQVVVAGPVTKVIEEVRQNAIHSHAFRIQVPGALTSQAQQALATLPAIKNTTLMGESAGWLRVELDNGQSSNQPLVNNTMLGALIHSDIPVLSFQSEGGRLQDVFLQLTEGAAYDL